MINESFARKRLIECCHLLYERNLTVSAGGNMSIRLSDNTFLITPSGVNKGLISEDDLVKMDFDGNVISGGKPSIEHRFHINIFKANPDTEAVIHCHPLYCIAAMLRDHALNTTITPEGVLLLDKTPMVRYEAPGSDELVEAIDEYVEYPAILLDKHGAITQGRTLEEAFNRMEELEFNARLQFLCPNVEGLASEEIEKLRRMR